MGLTRLKSGWQQSPFWWLCEVRGKSDVCSLLIQISGRIHFLVIVGLEVPLLFCSYRRLILRGCSVPSHLAPFLQLQNQQVFSHCESLLLLLLSYLPYFHPPLELWELMPLPWIYHDNLDSNIIVCDPYSVCQLPFGSEGNIFTDSRHVDMDIFGRLLRSLTQFLAMFQVLC